MQDLNVEFETLEEMENYEAAKSARDGHVKQFMDKTGLPKEHAEQYASAVVKYPNNAMAGAEQAADRIAGPKVKVKFHQSGQAYQDKHVAHVKTMKGIMHGTNEEVEVEMESQIDEGINSVKSMVEGILAGQLIESTETFSSILSDKISERLAEAKIEVAQGIFESHKADDIYTAGDVFDKHAKKDLDKPIKNAEVDEKEMASHPIHQLGVIGSYKPLTDEEKEANNFNTQRALAKRLAGQNVGNTLTVPKAGGSAQKVSFYNHGNGEESHIHPDDANLLLHTLHNVKPETHQSMANAIHGSAEGLQKVLKIVKSAPPIKTKSIYGDDARIA